jgi:glycine/serine hydroxymethyltransferase
MTMRGLDEDDFREVGAIICAALAERPDLDGLAARSEEVLARRPLYPGLEAFPTFGRSGDR